MRTWLSTPIAKEEPLPLVHRAELRVVAADGSEKQAELWASQATDAGRA
jgi:hypothetical protein